MTFLARRPVGPVVTPKVTHVGVSVPVRHAIVASSIAPIQILSALQNKMAMLHVNPMFHSLPFPDMCEENSWPPSAKRSLGQNECSVESLPTADVLDEPAETAVRMPSI